MPNDPLRDRIRALPAAPMPDPWRQRVLLPVGGLTEIGFGEDADRTEWLLVVSGSGRSVLSMSGEMVARDRDDSGDWQDPYRMTTDGIGPLAGVSVASAGLCGGGLAAGTSDGWSVARIALDWPDERVIVEPPRRSAVWRGHEDGCVTVLDDPVNELRAAGFSPSGRAFAIATTGDVTLYTRGDKGT